MKRHRALSAVSILVLAAGFSLIGCGDEPLSTPKVNQAPETELHARSPQLLGVGRFAVEFFWSGSDEDGRVVAYEYRLTLPDDSGAGNEGRWVRTTATTLRLELEHVSSDFTSDGPSYLFEVRSIDDRQVVDASPDFAAFTPYSLAPRVRITVPDYSGGIGCSAVAQSMYFTWLVEDDDTKGTEGLQTRWALIPVEDLTAPGFPSPDPETCLTRAELETMNPFPWIQEDRWSDWIDFDDPDNGGRAALVPQQEIGRAFIFVVQARDASGTRSRHFVWGDDYRHVRVSANYYPVLEVFEPFLGVQYAVGPDKRLSFQVLGGQELRFEWSADASTYAGIIEGYRYGWDVADPNDESDPGWAVPWGLGPSWLRAPVRSFSAGSHNFIVQTRDNSGAISRVSYDLEVLQQTPLENRYGLLLVFDYGLGGTTEELEWKDRWIQQWTEILTGVLPGFEPSVDIFDASSGTTGLDLELLSHYRSVIWFIMGASTRTAYNSMLSPLPGLVRYNWLEVYQAFSGNVLFVGPNASFAMIEKVTFNLPLGFTSTERLPDGLGSTELPGGDRVPAGTLRAPYSAFCIEAGDYVRPPGATIYGEEPGYAPQRTFYCDYLTRATVDEGFLQAYPSAAGWVQDLSAAPWPDGYNRLPVENGIPEDSAFFKLAWEEFYNSNATGKAINVDPRPCVQVMFRWTAARDDIWPSGYPLAGQPIVPPGNQCYPLGSTSSTVTGAPTAIMSSAYSDTKPLAGSHDFLWGFHPLAFDQQKVQAALAWIFQEDWGLAVVR